MGKLTIPSVPTVQPGTAGSDVVTNEAIERVQRQAQPEVTLPAAPAPAAPVPTFDSPLAQSLASQGYDITPQQIAPEPQVPQAAELQFGETLDPLQQEQRERERIEPVSQRSVVLQNEPAEAAFGRATGVTKVFDEKASGPTIPASLQSKSAFHEGASDRAYRGELSADRLLFDPNAYDAGEFNINNETRVNPMFGTIAGIVTENFFRNSGVQDGTPYFGNEFEQDVEPAERQLETPKAKDNARLGGQIWEEWMREKAVLDGRQSDEYLLTRQRPAENQLAAMGGMAKEAYAAANPDMVTVIRGQGEAEQTAYAVTPNGIERMDKSYAALSKPFESHEIPPLAAPSDHGQPQFEAGLRAKAQTTATGVKNAGPRINEAKRTYHDMKRTMVASREKTFYAQLVPGLLAAFEQVQPALITDSFGQHSFDPEILEQAPKNLYADAYKIGANRAAALVQQKKNQILEIEADIREQQEKPASPFRDAKIKSLNEQLVEAQKFSPALVYKADVLKALESLNTNARYANQIFHNTFSTQMLTGRLGIQQNKLNPQNNTMLRFVAGSPNVVRINPKASDAIANNFRETIGAHFLNGGTDLKPHRRVEAFTAWRNDRPFIIDGREFNGKVSWADAVAAGKEIKKWREGIDAGGARVALTEIATDFGAPLGQAIQPLTGLQFPALSPQTQQTLERIAGKKKSEIPYITDWLAAIADYDGGQPFATQTEVEVDGITHGISSNAMALGLEPMALRSGTINPHPDLKLTPLPTPKASTEVEGLTFNRDGTMTYEVTPEFTNWLDNRLKTGVRADVFTEKGQDKTAALFSNEMVEWLLQKSGLATKSDNNLVDYVDADGTRVDVKVIKPGARYSYSNSERVAPAKASEIDVVELWEAVDWKGRNVSAPAIGQKITVRPLGRVPSTEFFGSAEAFQAPTGRNSITHRIPIRPASMLPAVQLLDQPGVAGDLRDAMKVTMKEAAHDIATTLISKADSDSVDALVRLADNAIQDRDNYLKKSPMTLGYGQEVNSLKQHVKTTLNTGDRFKELNEIIDSDTNNVDRGVAIDYLHTLLVNSILTNMDPRVLETAAMLRANNLLAVLTDSPLYYDNGSGFRSNIASVTDLPDSSQTTTFTLKNEKGEPTTIRTPIYTEKYAAGSAPRTYQEGEAPVPGGFGHGRSIPTMAQTYDATMLSGVASGEKGKALKSQVKSRGYEYSWLPVFDAAKVDMAHLDVVRKAMNEEWLKGIQDNDYVGQIMGPGGWYEQTAKEFVDRIRALPQNQRIEIGPENEWRGMYYLLNDYFGASNYVRSAIGVEGSIGDPNDPDLAATILKRINADIRSAGVKVPFKDQPPVTELTPNQAIAVIQAWMHHLKVRERNAKLAREVKADRAKLFSKIRKEDVLQVDL